MLNAYSERMTNCGLKSEKDANLEEVLSIKLSLKHSLSIFAIGHFKSLDMAVVLLAFKKKKKPRYGCHPSSIFKKSRHGCCPAGIFKSLNMVALLQAFLKSLDMVVVMLTFLKA